MSGWKTTSSEVVYDNPWYSVRRDEVINHRGKAITYHVVDIRHPSVFIVAVNDAGEVLIQRNYRYPVDKNLWEIPAGHAYSDDLLASAKRELLEEAGLASDDWQKLGDAYQVVGIGNVPGTFFAARSVRLVTDERDPDEEISEQKFIPIQELEDMARTGQFQNAQALAGLYLARLHGIF